MRTRRPARQPSSCDGPSEPTTVTSRPPRAGRDAGPARLGLRSALAWSKGPGLLIPSTATLSDTPAGARDASERRTPSTIANASSSSGRTRRPAAARARSTRARSSNAIRSVGRHAFCHASAASSAPPAANVNATAAATTRGRKAQHAQAHTNAPTTRNAYANGRPVSGRRNPAAAPASRPRAGTAATSCTPAHAANFGTIARITKTRRARGYEVL